MRPVHHPELSPFCTELTSIRSEDLADAETFPNALARHRAWLESHDLIAVDGEERFAAPARSSREVDDRKTSMQ